VEDPCPGFQRLRDAVDMEWALLVHKLSALKDKIVAGGTGAGVDSSHVVEVTQVARDLKLVPAQVQFILNTIAYRQLKQQDVVHVGEKRTLDDTQDALPSAQTAVDALKKFRLGIKKQLLKANGDLKGLKKRDMQRELEVMYSEVQERFEGCCRKAYLWK
jgi:hypothetical protein